MQESMTGSHRVAAIQMASGTRVEANLDEASRLIAIAVAGGAGLVVLPENVAIMGLRETDKLACAETDAGGPLQEFFAAEAARHGVWLVAGTIPMATEVPDRAYSACLVFDSSGRRVARYDKLHLFDVQIEGEEAYCESATLVPGDRVVVVDTPFGRLGLAICYDLRFPEMFRRMVDEGVELIALPSAFTATTGEAHWRPLVRSRAIENLCYVIAANQGGYHVNGRETHGDSLVVDPWGRVLDSLARGSGVVFGDLTPGLLAGVRDRFPVLSHRRLAVSATPREVASTAVSPSHTAESAD